MRTLGKIKGHFIKHDINFLGYRKIFLTVAGVVMALCLVIVGVRGLNFGIEFVGGTSVAFHDTGDLCYCARGSGRTWLCIHYQANLVEDESRNSLAI